MSTAKLHIDASRAGHGGRSSGLLSIEPAELVALVVRSRRARLLSVHRHRLRREDLEDCFSQAALELVARARGGTPFASAEHIANALEQRFLSRINDRRRAIEGRSTAQSSFEHALTRGYFGGGEDEIPDPRVDLERNTILRHELGRIGMLADRLSGDQRLVLACQVAQMECAEFCERYGWSAEKYRKVAQRGRARLRALLDGDCGERPEPGDPLDRLQQLRARCPGLAGQSDERAGTHL